MRQTPRFSLRWPALLIVFGLFLLTEGAVERGLSAPEPQVTSEDDETPAAEAPPVPKSREPSRVVKSTKSTSSPSQDGPFKAVQSRLDRQSKEIAQLKQENVRLREQVRLLFSIVNKLAGLQQGQ